MAAGGLDALQPAGYAWAITPSDSTVFTETRGIYVGGGGDLVCDMYNPVTKKLASITLTGLAGGIVHPIKTTRIYAASTATGIVGLA